MQFRFRIQCIINALAIDETSWYLHASSRLICLTISCNYFRECRSIFLLKGPRLEAEPSQPVSSIISKESKFKLLKLRKSLSNRWGEKRYIIFKSPSKRLTVALNLFKQVAVAFEFVLIVTDLVYFSGHYYNFSVRCYDFSGRCYDFSD